MARLLRLAGSEAETTTREPLCSILFCAAFVLGVAGATEANGAPRFGHLTTQEGLSSNWVQAILQDRQGYLWFGTQDGLNRYDGAGFKVYRHDPADPHSLPSDVAGPLLEDRQGRLWVGSGWGDAGVALYDRRLDRFTTFRPAEGALIGNAVRALMEDRQGRIWLGTDDGLAEFVLQTGRFRRFPLPINSADGDPPRAVLALLEDARGRLWVGTYGGLLCFDRGRGVYVPLPGCAGDACGLRGTEIWALHEDKDGQLWIGTLGAGLHHFDPQTGQHERYMPDARNARSLANPRVRRIVPGGDDKLYLGMENGGLEVFDLSRRTFEHHLPDVDDPTSLNSSSIWSLARDDQGTLWIGTYNGGLNYMSPYQQRFGLLAARTGGLEDPHVIAVLEDRRGTLWVGMDGGGISRRDPGSDRFTNYRSRPDDPTTIGSDSVFALFEDSHGEIWLGGWAGGLGRLDRVTGRVRRYKNDPRDPRTIVSDHVWGIVELRTGELLVVTQRGADLFDRASGTFTRLGDRYPGASQDVALYAAAEDAAGNLWIAGSDLVRHVDRRSGQVTRYRNDPQDPQSLAGGWTQAVLVDRAGNAWFGTQRGLSCLTADRKRWRRYTTADGLADNRVVGLLEDDQGALWISTSRSIARLADAASVPDKPTIHSFDVNDGLQGLEFARNACAKGRDGTFYFGGARGLNWFRPEEIALNPRPPRVVLTGLRVMGRAARPGDEGSPLQAALAASRELRLSYRDIAVTFEFAALDFAVRGKNRFRYRLEGFDQGWSDPVPQHEVTYTNLPWGRELTFRVKAANNDGVWNEEGVSLRVFVRPPFWATPLFRGTTALLLLAAAFLAYRWRVRALRQRAADLTEKVNEAVAKVKVLRGLLPICSHCKRVRSDEGYWHQIEVYLSAHTEAGFTHGICPECVATHFPEVAARRAAKTAATEGKAKLP